MMLVSVIQMNECEEHFQVSKTWVLFVGCMFESVVFFCVFFFCFFF